MKNLKLILLLCFSIFSTIVFPQVSTGQEQEFDYGIRNNSSQTILGNPAYIVTQGVDGTYGKSTMFTNKSFLSTGLLKNGTISINVDNTKYDISAGVGVISNFDNPENPTSQIVNFPAVVGKTSTYLNTSNITYIAIKSDGTVQEKSTPFTNQERRSLILLGAVVHSNLTNINVVNNISAPSEAIANQLHDFIEAVGALNLTGNKYSPNGANLSLNKSAGSIFKLGVNFSTDWKNPHVLEQSSGTALTFRYRTQNGSEGSDVTVLNPTVYDLSNVLTSVPNNKFTIQTVTMFQTGLTRIQYGQNTYDTMAEAEAALFTRNYVVESNIAANGITRAYIIIKKECTSLLNTSEAKIIESTKFGSTASGGVALTFANIVSALGYTPANDIDVVHKTGNESISGVKTFTNRITITGTNATSNTSATAPLSVIGGNGGDSTPTTGVAIAGNASEIKIQGGNGGNALSSSDTNIGGSAGHIYLVGGDGGLSLGGSLNLPGGGGNATLQGGDSWGGVPGFASLKAGNNKVAGGFGSSVYIVPGWGNNSDTDDNYNGTIFLGLSPNTVSVRGNTVVGGTTDDTENRLQVNGSTKSTGGFNTFWDYGSFQAAHPFLGQNRFFNFSSAGDGVFVSASEAVEIDVKPWLPLTLRRTTALGNNFLELDDYTVLATNTAVEIASANGFSNLYLNSSGIGISTDGFSKTYFKTDNLTTDRTIQVPDESGEMALKSHTTYTQRLQSAAFSPNDLITYYIGNNNNVMPSTVHTTRRTKILNTGVISKVLISSIVNGTIGSGETGTFKLKNITTGLDATVSTTIVFNTLNNVNEVANISLAVTEGDELTLEFTGPTWATNPTNIIFVCEFIIKST